MRALPLLVPVLAAAGCSPLSERQVEGMRLLEGEVRSGYDGYASLDVRVEEGEEALLLTAIATPGTLVHVDRIVAPGGEVVLEARDLWADESISVVSGAYPFDVCTLNWPPRGSDRPLEPGRWTVELGTVEEGTYRYTGDVPVAVDLLLKPDDRLVGGLLLVDVVYAGTAGDDPELVEATEAATATWADLYDQVGLEVEYAWWDYPEGDLFGPGSGSAEDWREISGTTPLRAVNLVVVPEMRSGSGVYGQSGGIPGALVPSRRSGVLINALTHSGADLEFSTLETRLLAESMAHETGHFLGLFHPVEMSWDTWDALDDTPTCAEVETCEELMGENLMFPYPVCTQWSCRPQDALTGDQGEVMNLYVGVD